MVEVRVSGSKWTRNKMVEMRLELCGPTEVTRTGIVYWKIDADTYSRGMRHIWLLGRDVILFNNPTRKIDGATLIFGKSTREYR